MIRRLWLLAVIVGLFIALSQVVLGVPLSQAQERGLTDVRLPERRTVRFQLDWTPNTNHIGVYVARALGFYDDVNLDVQIVQPHETELKVIEAVESALSSLASIIRNTRPLPLPMVRRSCQ